MDEANHQRWGAVSNLLPGLAAAGAVLAVAGHVGRSTPIPSRRRIPRPLPTAPLDDRPAIKPRRSHSALLARIVAGGGLAWLLGPLPLAIGVVTFIAVSRVRTIARKRRMRREIDRDLPEALDLFVLLLEAGVNDRSVVFEMAHRGPTSTRAAFAQVVDRLDIGQPFAEAIVQLRFGLGTGAVALVDLMSASHRYGLPMAQVVNQLSTEARSARRRHNEALARGLPIKLSFPLVVCTLPSFVLLAIVPAVMAALSTLGSRAWTPPSS